MISDTKNLLTSAFWNGEDLCCFSGDDIPASLQLPAGAILFYSSGTSGVEKWVVHTRASLLASARAVNAHLQVTSDDVFGLLLPRIHVGGFGVLARAYSASAGYAIYPSRWDPQTATKFIVNAGITVTSLVPTQVYDLVKAGLPAPDSLRAVIVGGGTLDNKLGQKARQLGWPVLQSYGMSEAGSQVATAAISTLDVPFSNTNLSILPIWQTSTDEHQRLILSGEVLCAGILYREGGSFRYVPHTSYLTSDRVQIQGEMLTFLARKDRTVKVKGELVNLDALEKVLSEKFGRQFLLIAQAHERDGSSLHGFSTAPMTTETVNPLLPAYAPLQSYTRLDSLPVGALGKIDRRALLEFIK